MQIPDIEISPIQFQQDPEATRNFAIYTSRLTDLLRDIYQNLRVVKIVTAAPTAAELQELLNTSEIVILHDATQSNRKVYYKYQGTIFLIDSA